MLIVPRRANGRWLHHRTLVERRSDPLGMHLADTMFCSVVAHDSSAGAVLALLKEDAPGSIKNKHECCVHIVIQVSPHGRHCTCARHSLITYQYRGETLDPSRRAITQVRHSTAVLCTNSR